MGKLIDFNDGFNWHRGEMTFSFKHECFIARLPEAAVKALGTKEVRADTIKGCEEEWRSAIKRWRGVKVEKSHVIFYEFEGSERPNASKRKETFYPWQDASDRTPRTWNDFRDGDEVKGEWHGLRFRWSVCDLVEMDKKRILMSPDGKECQIDKDSFVMDWTQEREDFCRGLERALAELAVKACGFLDMSPREICARIDAKNLPPMIGFDGVKTKGEDRP